MGGDPIADLRAVTGDDVQDALGEAGGLEQPRDEKTAADRRLGGRFEHDAVAEGDRRRDRPQRELEREVPRRDDADDADRFALDDVLLPLDLRSAVAPRHPERIGGDVVHHLAGRSELPRRLRSGAAGLDRQQFRQLLVVRLDEVLDVADDLAALLREDVSPLFLRPSGRLERLVDVGDGARGNLAHDLARGGILDGNRLLAVGRPPLAVDVQAAPVRVDREVARLYPCRS